MTQENSVPETKGAFTMRQFMALLNEIQSLGVMRFAKMLDDLPEVELDVLLGACNDVRTRIARFRTKVG